MLANYLKIGECTYSKTYKDFKKQDIQLFPHRNECDKGFASDFSLRTEGHKLIKKTSWGRGYSQSYGESQ